MTEIAALAKARGLFVIEDCAEAHGARYDGKPVGSFSRRRQLLLLRQQDHHHRRRRHLPHQRSPTWPPRMRMLRDHGMRPERRYWHDEPGFNFRMTNLQAAIGCAQIERMDELIDTRGAVHAALRDRAGRCAGPVAFRRPCRRASSR